MAIVSVAITLSFHLNHEPSHVERRIAKPLGAIFWVLAVLTLAVGIANYVRKCICISRILLQKVTNAVQGTVNLYSKKAAIVQTGWKTQAVSY